MPIRATPSRSRKARNVLIIKTRKSLKRSLFSKSSRTFLISKNLNDVGITEIIASLYPINYDDIRLEKLAFSSANF
jgi:hypothetical protein